MTINSTDLLLLTGKPAAPSNCAVANQTADSVRVDCQEAFDGGLQQTFGLELVDRDTRAIRYYFNNSKPIFTVYGLEPETAFLLNIFALNAKGRSNQITLETTTLRAAEKHIGKRRCVPPQSLLLSTIIEIYNDSFGLYQHL